ncbi:MAG: glycosyltransferase family 39 protein [Anaerolineae bacterium]|nr:glycosyltransferase family 39 protein [Anaerolineae bacterium]
MEIKTTPNRKSLFILVTILIIVVVSHAQNLFLYPYYTDVEGTQIANGWSMATKGELSPYTFSYEEPPIGTFVMSAWLSISGGLSSFGFPINSGRTLMLILHVLTVALIYGIAKKTSKSDLTAAIAAIVFSFSPLATILQRRVLLDNIMIVWLLTAFYLVLGERRTLGHYLASAAFFGLSVLTRGATIFFIPAFIYTIRLRSDPHHRRFATMLWLALAAVLIAYYPLYAQMKLELFPQGWLLGGDFPHVSLIGRLLDRGPDTGRFLNIASGVAQSFKAWTDMSSLAADPVLVFGGIISTIFVLILSVDNPAFRPLVAMVLAFCLNLLFGGQIFDSAAVWILPFFAVNVGLVTGALTKIISNTVQLPIMRYALMFAVGAILLYPFWVFDSSRAGIYTINQVEGQLEAVNWIKTNVPKDAVVVTDNFAFVDLRQSFDNAHHYWQVDTDPAIKFNVLDDNLCSIDYMITTPQVSADIGLYKLDLMRRTMESSQVLVRYPNNGWPVEIRQVNKQNCAPKIASNDAPVTKKSVK